MSPWAPLWVMLGVLAVVAGFLLHSGLLSRVSVRSGSPPIGNVTLAYKYKEGLYGSRGQVLKECRAIGPGLACVGVFYDDPKKVQGRWGRYAVGSILSEGGDETSAKLRQRYEKSGFKFFSFPEVMHAVTTSFPHRTFFSIVLAIIRVYPQLENYIKERRLCAHPFLEIYRGGQIQYMVPLARQGDFYVPELRHIERRLSGDGSGSETDISGAESNSGYSSESSRESSPERRCPTPPPCHGLDHEHQRGKPH